MSADPVRLFLCGDVMLGRGVDQILPHPGDPTLREPYVLDARTYVELAESVNGPIPRPVDFAWPWGEALELLDQAAPEVRVLNLETSITRSDDFATGKDAHYRMHPANLPCLAAARPDVCVLANNHVMDFGLLGLAETLDTLASADLTAVGAGWDAGAARKPAIVTVDGGRRVLVFAFGTASSGIPWKWAAAEDRPGVDFVSEASDVDAADVVDRVRQVRRPGDVVVASIHWGSNWGYQVSRDQTLFAHALIDGGVDVVYGHSSHHPRPIEVYRGKLVLYGCGDFIDDYEGITGHEHYRDDLRLLYFVSVEPSTGRLVDARMAPVQARQMRLEHACAEDVQGLREVLERVSRGFGVRIDLGPDGMLTLRGG
ncbi:CapA family protein [Kitasatospora sp. NPDC101155]|uniref:CapA family protein n=1 Tax=Kitasatospora sp. NPDC101155 TaxID=3364097 RepID=UPI0038018E18